MDENRGLVVFQDKKVRRTWHNGEWCFSVVDIVAILTEQEYYQKARKHWNKLIQRLREEGSEVVTNCHRLKLPAEDGKLRETDCANVKAMFRIIQAIPSQKAEPFKLWLAQVGYERVEEIKNPELAQKRMKDLYRAKGYSDEWIEKRVRGIAVRQELTDEWKKRDIDEKKEFAVLTNEISKAAFGKTVEEYKEFKGLGKENLRDHMNDLELIFNMLGEAVTTGITRVKDAKGFGDCKGAAKQGGEVAGNAMAEAEKKMGWPIVSGENYLDEPEKVKRKRITSKASQAPISKC